MMSTYSRSRFHNVGYRLAQVREQLGFVAPLTEQDYQEVAALLPTAAALSLFRTMSPADQQHSLRVCRRLIARDCKDKDMLAAALLHDVGKAQGRVPFWTRPAIVLGKKLAPRLLTRLVTYPEKGPITRRGGGGEEEGRGPLGRPRPLRGVDPWTVLANDSPGGNEGAASRRQPQGIAPTMDERAWTAASEHSRGDPLWSPWLGLGRPHSQSGTPHPNIPNWRLSLSYAWYHADVGADLASAAGLSERAVLYIRTHHQPGGPAAELHEVDEVS